jgi:hypothetical protein
MTLHEAIIETLKRANRAMTTQQIADDLNRTGLYRKRDGSAISAFQIHGRTRNYSHLFNRDGNTVSLKGEATSNVAVSETGTKSGGGPFAEIPQAGFDKTETILMDTGNFKGILEIEGKIPARSGLYALRLKEGAQLPDPFGKILSNRNHNTIYIGIATKSLQKRLNQELLSKGHGTFFRSIGAVLGFCPPAGSLVNMKNKRNYKFSAADTEKIISWLGKNLLVSMVEVTGKETIKQIENYLIPKYKPLLNLDKNPLALPELSVLRKQCVEVGNNNYKA